METHEERARHAADSLRGMMLTLAAAGIGAAYALRGDVGDGYWKVAATCFVLALAFLLRSWFLVKARALDRAAGTPEALKRLPTSKCHLRASWTWDTGAAWALIVGAATLAVGLA